MGYGTGAIMAVPGQDQRDWDFAEAFGLPIVRTVQPPDGWDGRGVHRRGPGDQQRQRRVPGRAATSPRPRHASPPGWPSRGSATATVTYKLRDWLFSPPALLGRAVPDRVRRARPAHRACPTTSCPCCCPRSTTTRPAPSTSTTRPPTPSRRSGGPTSGWRSSSTWATGRRPTAASSTRCRTGPARAGTSCATSTPPTRTPSSIPRSSATGWGPQREGDTGGVDLYVGGVEHAVLHLLYARFWHKVLFDLGHLSSCEPFRRLVNQGYIQAPAYTDDRGFYVEASEVERARRPLLPRRRQVTREFGKIGKSLKNIDHPRRDLRGVRRRHAAAVRDVHRPARPEPAVGDQGRRRRVPPAAAHLAHRARRGHRRAARRPTTPPDDETLRVLHRTIAAVRDGMETLRFNTSIARITELNNHLTADVPRRRRAARGGRADGADAGAARAARRRGAVGRARPHRERWRGQPFPEADPAYLVDDTVEIPVQVNGKVRGQAPGRRRPRRRPRSRPPPAPTPRSPSCWTAGRSARSSPSPTSSSTSSSAEAVRGAIGGV